MNQSELLEWTQRNDTEFISTFTNELRIHIHSLRDGEGFDAYAVCSLVGHKHKVQYLSAKYNHELSIPEEYRHSLTHKFIPNEWTYTDENAFPKTAEILDARNEFFELNYKKDDDSSFVLDDIQIAHSSNLHRSLLKGMKAISEEGLLGGDSSFAILWAPDAPDHSMYCSVMQLNSDELYSDFMFQFGRGIQQPECDCFE